MKKFLFVLISIFSFISIASANSCEVLTGDGTNIGDAIKCESEEFNVISNDGNNIVMLPKYNIGAEYKQTSEVHEVGFANVCDWEYRPAPKEVDIQQFDGPTKEYINKYKEYLQTYLEEPTINVDLVSLVDLKDLNCKINDDYTYSSDMTCVDSPYADWIINGQYWWLKSAYAPENSRVFIATDTGRIAYGGGCWFVNGVRPLVTIPVTALKKYISTKTDGNGDISVVDGSKEGEEITFTVTPKEGYVLKGVKVMDTEGNVVEYNENTFTMPSSDVTIEAIFEKEIINPNTSAKNIVILISLTIVLIVLSLTSKKTIKNQKY